MTRTETKRDMQGNSAENPLDRLEPQEKTIVLLRRHGYTSKAIAKLLEIPELKTPELRLSELRKAERKVNKIREKAYRKLRVKTDLQLVLKLHKEGEHYSLQNYDKVDPNLVGGLTSKEKETLNWLTCKNAKYDSNEAIARRMRISTNTVKNNITSINEKLQIDNVPSSNKRMLAGLMYLEWQRMQQEEAAVTAKDD